MTMAAYKKWITITWIFLVFFTVLSLGIYWRVLIQNAYDKQYIYYANELRVITQRIAKHSIQAVFRGSDVGFSYLKQMRSNLEAYIFILKNGKIVNGETILPPSSKKIQDTELKAFIDFWDTEKPEVDTIVNNENIDERVNKLNSEITNNLLKIADTLRGVRNEIITETHTQDKIQLLISIEDLTEDIKTTLDIVLNLQNVTPSENYPRYSKLVNELIEKINKLKQEIPEAQSKLIEIQAAENNIVTTVPMVLTTGKTLDAVQLATNSIFDKSIPFLNKATDLSNAYFMASEYGLITQTKADIISMIPLVFLLLLMYLVYKRNKLEIKITEEKNKALRDEIHKLVSEISGLAKGDLAIKVSLEEGVTQDIAVAINYALETLRKLISNIYRTTEAVASSAFEANKIIEELAQSSKNQTSQIVEVTSSSSTMKNWIEEVSSRATESVEVAGKSVDIANEGGKVVRNTLDGMERIQIQIQETANRVRRLSESSQEIGEIVSLIEDIADQTNILSLNASIQAAMAGEAGKGFAVVADEVQRLAEKASYATKEIDTLVRSIQTETNQVISSMEEAKTEVVQGVTLAKDAGFSLEKIEAVSKDLAALIQHISSSAKAQAEMSKNISDRMNTINDIAKSTSSGTTNSVELIKGLSKLVLDLRSSVSEFKLPNSHHV